MNWNTAEKWADDAIQVVLIIMFVAIPMFVLILALQFGIGYAVGLLVEWMAGKEVVLGPLRLPYWMGMASCLVAWLSRIGGDS